MPHPDEDRRDRHGADHSFPETGAAAARPQDPPPSGGRGADLVDLLQSPACVIGRSGGVRRMNAAWRAFADHGDDAGASWLRLIHPVDRYVAMSHLHALDAAGSATEIPCRLADRAGGHRWFLLSLQKRPDDASEDAALCLAFDIHAMKLREIDLERRASIQADMLDVSVDCIKLISLEGELIHMNRAGRRALGLPDDSPFGMPWLPLLPSDVWEVAESALKAAREGLSSRFPGRSRLPGQKPQHWDNMLSPILGADGAPAAILCVSREVSAEHDAYDALRQSQERLAAAVRVGGLGIWDYDILNDDLICDDVWHRIMGRDPRSPIRSVDEFRLLVHPEDVERATEVRRAAAKLVADRRDYAVTFRIVRPDGEIRWVRSVALVQSDAGEPRRAVGFVMDVTEARRGELALRDANRTLLRQKMSLTRQSLEDPLTGLPNRRHLDMVLAKLCGGEGPAGEIVCVGMADVDHFKAFNDRYGHPEGDAALRAIARALRSAARTSDFVARYGGEEFAFALNDVADPAGVLDRFLSAVAELNIPHADSPLGRLAISCGCIVRRRGEGMTPGELLKASDAALYEAKLAGRGRSVVRNAL